MITEKLEIPNTVSLSSASELLISQQPLTPHTHPEFLKENSIESKKLLRQEKKKGKEQEVKATRRKRESPQTDHLIRICLPSSITTAAGDNSTREEEKEAHLKYSQSRFASLWPTKLKNSQLVMCWGLPAA